MAKITVASTNPVPLINEPLLPMTTAPGGPSFTLKVSGSGFVPSSVVNWNGKPLTTTYVSDYQLNAAVPSEDIASATTASVTVSSEGSVTSNVQFFNVSEPIPVPTFTIDAPGFANVVPRGRGLPVDINGDGKLDWVGPADVGGVCCQLVVLLGNGDGSFQSPVAYPIPNNAFSSIGVGDFNGDGRLDVVVGGSGAILVFLGNGDGTLMPPASFSVPNTPIFLVVGDLNRDGILDVATGNSTSPQASVSILLGNGDGSFQNHVDYSLDVPTINGMVIGDFNSDTRLDIVCATQFSPNSAQLSILLGLGDGTFASVRQSSMTYAAQALIAADLNGDGTLDLVTTTDTITGAVTVFLGNGDATFRDGVIYLTGGGPDTDLVAGDFNADGKLDLAVNTYAPDLTLLFGAGDGTFPSGTSYSVNGGFSLWAAGDFNGDGKWDMVGYGKLNDGLTLLLQ